MAGRRAHDRVAHGPVAGPRRDFRGLQLKLVRTDSTPALAIDAISASSAAGVLSSATVGSITVPKNPNGTRLWAAEAVAADRRSPVTASTTAIWTRLTGWLGSQFAGGRRWRATIAARRVARYPVTACGVAPRFPRNRDGEGSPDRRRSRFRGRHGTGWHGCCGLGDDREVRAEGTAEYLAIGVPGGCKVLDIALSCPVTFGSRSVRPPSSASTANAEVSSGTLRLGSVCRVPLLASSM